MWRVYVIYRRISSLNFYVTTSKGLKLDRIESDLTELKSLIDELLNDIKIVRRKNKFE